MKLEISKIIALYNNGVLNTTEHDVPVADAYKASKFRRELKKAFDEIVEKEKSLAKDAGIEDISKIDEAPEEQKNRFAELRAEMLKDELDLNIKPMSYESFHALAKENRSTAVQVPVIDKDGKQVMRTVTVDPYRNCEDLLEGVLWEAPKEDEE